MKALVFILCIGIFQAVYADAIDDGYKAVERGDHKTAFDLWFPLAEQGHAGMQHNLGRMYAEGLGVQQDYKEAVRWRRKAVDVERRM